MDKNLSQYKEQYRTHHMSTGMASVDSNVKVCPNCGTPVSPDARFCENCGAPQSGGSCRHCNAAIKPGQVICPVCGKPCTTVCTFCGSEMGAGEPFCSDCGNPRSGISCPDCGTLNFRSFCRKCHRPLNPLALHAIEQAKANKHVQRARQLNLELDRIEKEIAQLEAEIAAAPEQAYVTPPPAPAPVVNDVFGVSHGESTGTRNLLDQFAALSGAPVETTPPPAAQTAVPKPATPVSLSLDAPAAPQHADISAPGAHKSNPKASRLEQLKAMYSVKLNEFQAELDAMVPDPADPPEIKRNFACACRYCFDTYNTSVEVIKKRVAWVCNRCHVRHNDPSECCVREYGGKWITDTVTVTKQTVTHHSGEVSL